ncbi:MAG: PAS domain S-box protein, partial [Acidobacteriota bacterium]
MGFKTRKSKTTLEDRAELSLKPETGSDGSSTGHPDQEAPAATELRYRELVENANDIVFTLDLSGNVTSINKAVERIMGYSQEELLRMKLDDFLTPESVSLSRHMTERKLAGEEQTRYEVESRAKDGSMRTLEINSALLLNEGRLVGVLDVVLALPLGPSL